VDELQTTLDRADLLESRQLSEVTLVLRAGYLSQSLTKGTIQPTFLLILFVASVFVGRGGVTDYTSPVMLSVTVRVFAAARRLPFYGSSGQTVGVPTYLLLLL
jgi:hypothetical protein